MKVVAALIFLLIFNSCDDGDLKLESFNFDAATIQKCPTKTFLYKINSNEMLVLNIPENSFENTVTAVNEPRIIQIGGANSITYRKYNANATTNVLCNDLPPASPVVLEEWQATGGQVQVITTSVINAQSVIIGYQHNIVFLNVNFYNPANSFSFQSYNFGTYDTGL